jgi:hypothetical protein
LTIAGEYPLNVVDVMGKLEIRVWTSASVERLTQELLRQSIASLLNVPEQMIIITIF